MSAWRVALLALLVSCTSPRSPDAVSRDVGALRAVFDRWNGYIVSSQFDSLPSLTTRDFILVESGERVPIESVVVAFRAIKPRDAHFTITDVSGERQPDLGYLVYTSKGSYVTGASGSRTSVDGTGSIIFRREGGAWRMAVWTLTGPARETEP